MSQRPKTPAHPGAFIRECVIPAGMSVTDAARNLGVGRPALSNLLNGKSSLSPKMAARLEKAFRADRRELLDRQAAFDRHGRQGEERLIAVRPHVPEFLTVTAREIESWADGNIEARRELPALLRKLIHSTGDSLRHVDFPAGDNAERKGWDGRVGAGAATPWIPEGASGWEFGVDKNPRRKAEKDYAARLRSVPADERAECVFVFVTPRNWPSKAAWVEGKRASGEWKDVRAFDASDLEQWLETSIPARIWIAEKLGLPVDGFRTLDECRGRWAEAAEPVLTPAIFAPSLAAHRGALRDWLGKPSTRLFTVAADSREEALAFLACLFGEDGIDTRWRDLAAVFDSVEALRKLAASNAPFLPVVHTDAVERELAAVHRQRHCIAVRPRNAVGARPDIALDLLDRVAFDEALAAMGVDEGEIDRLARESGRSPTILRRRLSKVPAIRTPEWAADDEIARALIPMALVGAWRNDFGADREVLSCLEHNGYERIEKSIARLLQLDDGPIWAVGTYRGVASKIDALFAIAGNITGQDLDNFFDLAEYVLSETDPALELPESERWSAGLYGKVRDHSDALREGVCETLVLLSVHDNDLFRPRLGIDVEARVSATIHNLLTPLTLDKLLSQGDNLPRYAEAAPEEFLNLIEEDLKQTEPVVFGLLKPVDNALFSRCLRTGLLWALECLAWKRLGRVSAILAQLSSAEIDDNWTNKPIASLADIYRSWLPQTAVSFEERMQSLDALTERFPNVGWRICIAQLDTRMQIAIPNYRPRWRSDATGAGRTPETADVRRATIRKALELVLAWPEHNSDTLGDLVDLIRWLPGDEARNRVWDLIEAWAASGVGDDARNRLRDRIRRLAFTYGGRKFLDRGTRERAHVAYAELEPGDLTLRHAWLFANHWIDFSVEDVEDDSAHYGRRSKKIALLRTEAMKQIWAERGFDGVMALFSNNCLGDVVGDSLGSALVDTKARIDFLKQSLSAGNETGRQVDDCIRNFLLSVGDEERKIIFSAAIDEANADETSRLLRCAPFRRDTWRFLDRFDPETRDRYWREVTPEFIRHSEAELAELIDRLLAAKRPRAAFNVVKFDWSRIETSRLKTLLFDTATVNGGPTDHYEIEPYCISDALNALGERADVTPDDMAQLEFMYFKALDNSEHGIPNIERRIAEDPGFFVRILAMGFKRDDGGDDPSEWRVQDPESDLSLARTAFRILGRIGRVPGVGENGKIDSGALFDWIDRARRLCAECGRSRIGDHYIGKMLSKSPAEGDGAWPCLAVCEAMERIASPEIGRGFHEETLNSRGVSVKTMGEGGAQECALSDKYRNWAQQRAFDYPHVSGVLESVAASYDELAVREDDDANTRNRLWY